MSSSYDSTQKGEADGDLPGKSPRFEAPDDATRYLTSAEQLDGPNEEEFEFNETPEMELGDLTVLGEYLLLEQIGAGGMGRVYRAEHRTMNRLVALKVLSDQIVSKQLLMEQFLAEIRVVAKLMHPNIVTAFDAGSVDGKLFLVMELVEGEVLSSRIRKQGILSSSQAVNVLEQAAKALQFAHSLGIVHRDIKPGNMMLTPDGTLKILDFGLARFGDKVAVPSSKNMLMGTPEYMAPEQIESPDDVDARSDLYSLGATLYFLLTGRPMFSGERLQIAMSQLRQKPPALFLERGDVDLRLDAVFQRLVAKKPSDRYASAQELLDSLKSANLVGSSVGPSQSSGSGQLLRGVGRLNDSPTSVAFHQSTLAKKSQIVAIDLGMMVSSVAFYNESTGPQLVSLEDGAAVGFRNMVWSSGEKLKFGSAASALRSTEPQRIIHSVQRSFGQNNLAQNFCGQKVPPVVVLAAMLRQMMAKSGSATDFASSAIVTVPSSYDQMHRRAVRDACRIGGIDLVQLLDKPLAATLSWLDVNAHLSTQAGGEADKTIAFVHVGGTGLEAAILRSTHHGLQQIACDGHWKLGSLRWQNLLAEYFVGVLKGKTGKSIREDVAAATRLQRSIELAMNRLTTTNKVEVRFEWNGAKIEQIVTQQGLVKIAPDLVQRIAGSLQKAASKAKVELEAIDQVLLAGSMMKMRPVQNIIRNLFPSHIPVDVLEKGDMARGAAIQARYAMKAASGDDASRFSAIGCCAYDLAVLIAGNERSTQMNRCLLRSGTALPGSGMLTLQPTTDGNQDNEASMPDLQLIESTSVSENDWHLLGSVSPRAMYPDRGAKEPLQLRFEVNESGLLTPSLLWPAGNRVRRIPMSVEDGMSESQVEEWQRWLENIFLCSTD